MANDEVVDDEEAAAFRLLLVDKNDSLCDDGDLFKWSICLLIGVENDKNWVSCFDLFKMNPNGC